MKKGFNTFICSFLIFIIVFSCDAQSKLVILSPKEMINDSDLIITGIVEQKFYRTESRKVVISVSRVLKGRASQRTLYLEGKRRPYGWVGFDFPESGTKVMLLMKKNGLTSDANNIAVVDSKGVKLFHPIMPGGKYIPGDYERMYLRFLQYKCFWRLMKTFVIPSLMLFWIIYRMLKRRNKKVRATEL